MESLPITWADGTETQVTADAAINSDPQLIAGLFGWSLTCLVTGLAPNGISGALMLQVTNDPLGLAGWTLLDGSVQSVDVANDATETLEWSYIGSKFYQWARLVWVQAGAPDSGELGAGTWGLTPQAVSPTVVPVMPTILPVNAGVVMGAVDRLAQYLKGLPTNPTTGV